MNGFNKFMGELKDLFDEEKRIIAQKNIYKRKIDRIKRIDEARKDLDKLKKELESLENGHNNK